MEERERLRKKVGVRVEAKEVRKWDVMGTLESVEGLEEESRWKISVSAMEKGNEG